MPSRTECLTCRRPEPRCVCALRVRVDNRTAVTILQHPRERRHPFNTGRLARESLRNAELHVLQPDERGRLRHRGPLPAGAALLYPHPDAVELASVPLAQRPRHLIVLDGTWAQARVVYRDDPRLAALPHVALTPAAPSRYRIRREPAPHCLSTIESVAAALAVLEPEAPGLSGLLDAFVAMVDTQADEVGGGARRRRRSRPRRGPIARLATEWDRVVVGYAEARRGERGALPSLVRWAAVRPATGQVFDASVTPATVQAFVAGWAAFAGPDAAVACWSHRAAPLLAQVLRAPVDAISLRSAYGNVRAGAMGYLDDLTAREGCVVVPQPVAGRAGERLGHALALATFLRGMHR
jgi:DTW domain-containing protein